MTPLLTPRTVAPGDAPRCRLCGDTDSRGGRCPTTHTRWWGDELGEALAGQWLCRPCWARVAR